MAASFFLNYVTSMLNLTVRAQQVGMPLQAMLQQGESLITRARNNCVANSTLSHHGYKTDQGDFATSLLQALPYRRCHMPSALRHRQARVMQLEGSEYLAPNPPRSGLTFRAPVAAISLLRRVTEP